MVKKNIIIYYSYGGNTEKIAKIIQEETGADLVRIDTAVPYTGDYDTVVDQGHREINSGFMPELKPLNVDLSGYDNVILGTPVWWYTFAPAMNTFLHDAGLAGKAVYPFATNGGWIGHTFQDFKKACADADVKDGLNVRFDEDRLCTEEETVRKWAQKIAK